MSESRQTQAIALLSPLPPPPLIICHALLSTSRQDELLQPAQKGV